MDMSSAAAASSGSTADGMEGWKPYLHTSLFSAFSNDAGAGEPFLFPTFRIYSRTTFIGACLFTFMVALVERWLSYLLDTTFSLEPPRGTPARGQASGSAALDLSTPVRPAAGGVYVTLPSNATVTGAGRKGSRRGMRLRVAVRTVVYFVATLLRYVLMIVSMGMDWALLLSVVSGLAVGHLLRDVYWLASTQPPSGGASGEELELLHHAAEYDLPDVPDDPKPHDAADADYLGATAHRRSSSRQAALNATTPY